MQTTETPVRGKRRVNNADLGTDWTSAETKALKAFTKNLPTDIEGLKDKFGDRTLVQVLTKTTQSGIPVITENMPKYEILFEPTCQFCDNKDIENCLCGKLKEYFDDSYKSELSRLKCNKPCVRLTLLYEFPWSLNIIWAGIHWGYRKKERDRIHEMIKTYLYHFYTQEELDSLKEYLDHNVEIEIILYSDTERPYCIEDPDNVLIKPFIDGLKGIVIIDDTFKVVSKVSSSIKHDSHLPRLEINVYKRL